MRADFCSLARIFGAKTFCPPDLKRIDSASLMRTYGPPVTHKFRLWLDRLSAVQFFEAYRKRASPKGFEGVTVHKNPPEKPSELLLPRPSANPKRSPMYIL